MGKGSKPESKTEEKETSKDFSSELKKHGFDDATVSALHESGFDSIERLELLAGEEEAMKDLPICIAQRLRLKKFVRTLSGDSNAHVTPAHRDSVQSTKPVTLNQVLSDMSHDGQSSGAATASVGGGTQGTQRAFTPSGELFGASVQQTTDPQVGLYLRGGCDVKDKTAYEIVDYIHLVPPIVEEQIVSEQGNSQFILRSAAKKPKLHNVTVEEWCLANTRIMDILINTTPDVLRDYLSYTMKVCELFKCYERTSVLQYDREYRHTQARHSFRWGTDAPHLHTLHLRLKQTTALTGTSRASNHSQQQRSRRPAQSSESHQPICYQFNSKDGCTYGSSCKYKHACSEPGCNDLHSRASHHTQSAPATSR